MLWDAWKHRLIVPEQSLWNVPPSLLHTYVYTPSHLSHNSPMFKDSINWHPCIFWFFFIPLHHLVRLIWGESALLFLSVIPHRVLGKHDLGGELPVFHLGLKTCPRVQGASREHCGWLIMTFFQLGWTVNTLIDIFRVTAEPEHISSVYKVASRNS